jgi:hypothetical protein
MTSQEWQGQEPSGGRSRATTEAVDAILDREIVKDGLTQVAVLGVELASVYGRCVIRSADLAAPVVRGRAMDDRERRRTVSRHRETRGVTR